MMKNWIRNIKMWYYRFNDNLGGVTKLIDESIIEGAGKIRFTAEIPKEEWAPGIYAGSEGMRFILVKIDLENRKLTLEWDGDYF